MNSDQSNGGGGGLWKMNQSLNVVFLRNVWRPWELYTIFRNLILYEFVMCQYLKNLPVVVFLESVYCCWTFQNWTSWICIRVNRWIMQKVKLMVAKYYDIQLLLMWNLRTMSCTVYSYDFPHTSCHRWASPFSPFAKWIASVCFFLNKWVNYIQTSVCTMSKR